MDYVPKVAKDLTDPARAARHDAPGRYIRNVKEDAQREKDEQAKNDQNND